MQRNFGISLVRVTSMMMIVLCHIFNYLNISWLSQFFNVGVYTFLLISGWLYSNKDIDESFKWLFSRWKKICIPVLVYLLITILFCAVVFKDCPPIYDTILYIFNLQGLSWIIYFFPSIDNSSSLSGLGNLWFVTVIMLCYILLVFVKKLEKQKTFLHKETIFVLTFIIFLLSGLCNINLSYFICFFVGYRLGKNSDSIKNKYSMITICLVLSILFRLISKNYIDGTNVYNIIVVGITHTVISIWIFSTIIKLYDTCCSVKKFASGIIINKLDDYSYYIYITHYFFLVKYFRLKQLTPFFSLQMLLFVIFTALSTLIVFQFSQMILKKWKK